jgi:hypothetical protein
MPRTQSASISLRAVGGEHRSVLATSLVVRLPPLSINARKTFARIVGALSKVTSKKNTKDGNLTTETQSSQRRRRSGEEGDRRLEAEDRGPRTEEGGRKTEDRGRKTERRGLNHRDTEFTEREAESGETAKGRNGERKGWGRSVRSVESRNATGSRPERDSG